MSDYGRSASDGETPVNPYSLLDAVNRSSDTAHMAWLIFLGIMAYFMIAVAGVTHRDLLLETAVSLPILGVDIQLTQFFQFAPIVLVLFHLGLIGQLVLLARKTVEFDAAIRLLETSDRRTHPLRLELHNFFFVQAVAGPHRSAVMGGFLHAMSWLTLVILPVVLILYIQLVFLPYHDTLITWTHRIALVFDILMLTLLGTFLRRAEASFFSAFWRTTIAYPISFVLTTALLTVVTVFSFLFATVPGEALDRVSRVLLPAPEKAADYRAYTGFVGPLSWVDEDGALFGIFLRNLRVTDADLVSDKEALAGERTLNLRERDLRSAKLDRSDLHQADLTGAILDDASLAGANLRDVKLDCADLTEFLLSEDREVAVCTSARRADFTGADLSGAQMTGLDAREGKFESAKLTGANMSYAVLAGAMLVDAKLDRANLTGGIKAAGADFSIASLRGADLTGGKLYGADFRSSEMQGAIFNYASLQGAAMEGAKLQAASLQRAVLWGADMSRTDVTAADLRGVKVWMAVPPDLGNAQLTDFSGMDINAPAVEDIAVLKTAVEEAASGSVRRQVMTSMTPLFDEGAQGWNGSGNLKRWLAMAARRPGQTASLVGASDAGASDESAPDSESAFAPRALSYKDQLTRYLNQMMCRARWADGSVAAGVALRARGPQFRGNLKSIYERLTSTDCPGGKALSEQDLRDMSAAADSSS